MSKITELFQTADWKNEKHVPAITAPEKVKSEELFNVEVSVGKEIAHPNTMEHHIAWIKLYYLAKDSDKAVEIADARFTAHGEGNAYTEPTLNASVKLNKCGKLIATSYCNIHGLWTSEVDITVEG